VNLGVSLTHAIELEGRSILQMDVEEGVDVIGGNGEAAAWVQAALK
jgi:hypothetical protein